MKKEPCKGCALRPGAAANLEPENHLTALLCTWGPMPFWCHEHLDWQRDFTLAEKREQIRENRIGICQGWVREVKRLNASGYYKEHREVRRLFAQWAIAAMNTMKTSTDELERTDAHDLLEFYVKELCQLEVNRIKKLTMNEKEQLNCFDEGGIARKAGVAFVENPYHPETNPDERHAWAEGWNAMDFCERQELPTEEQ